MEYKGNQKLVPLARELRKDMTKEERHLWYDFLRKYPVCFTRQKVLGRYIADFYCARAKLVIELDGSQHYEPDEMEKDRQRTHNLRQYDLQIVRIPNNEVMNNFRGVCEYIDQVVQERTADSDPLSQLRWQLPLRRGAIETAYKRSAIP